MRQSARTFRGLLLAATTLVGVAGLAAEPPPPASVALTLDTSGSGGRAELERARDLALANLTGGEYFAVDQARGADLAALIAALPAGGAPSVSATAAGGTGKAASGPAAAGATTRRPPPATVPARLVTPSTGGRRAVWIAL